MAKDAPTAKVIDFTNVKDSTGSFNKRRVPAGDYLAKITKAEDAPSKKDDVHQYLFTIKLVKFNDRAFPYYCKLQENQLWKLRNIFIAAGVQVPKKRVKVDPLKVVGKTIGVTMEDDEYEGKLQSNISSVFPASELSEDGIDPEDLPDADEVGDDADDEDLSDVGVEGDEEEEVEEDEADAEPDIFDNMDRSALKVYIKDRDAAFRFLKSLSDDDLRAAARNLISDAPADEDEDEEDEEEPPPPPKKTTAKKKAAPVKAEVDDDELEELDISDL